MSNTEDGNGRHRATNTQVHVNPDQEPDPWSGSWFTPKFSPATWATGFRTQTERAAEAGIRAGEVVGYRIWRVIGNYLFSIFMHDCEWMPGRPMTGDVDEAGVFAFKEPGIQFDAYLYENLIPIGPSSYVSGTVEMWGRIVEHEHGYRAEYAKIRSLKMAHVCPAWGNVVDVHKLRQRYGVGED